MDDGRYMTIPPGAIVPGALPEFKIYLLSPQGHYVLWALEGHKVSANQLARISGGGINHVYVDLDDKFKYDDYLESNLGKILENQVSSVEQKAEIFSQVSARVVKSAFETSFGVGIVGPSALQRMEKMVKNALLFLSESNSLRALTQMIGHDYKTYEHATKVLWFTVAFLKDNPSILEIIQPNYPELNENQKLELLRQCGVGALLHDIGKVFIPPEIINKKGPLNEVEWEIMKRHPLNSLVMLLDTKIPEFVRKAISQHHEDFDGGGYPMGLRGLHISILARVLRIVDSFDAMTSKRPYKEPMPPRKVLEIMIATPPGKANPNSSGPKDRDQGMMRCFDEDLVRKFILLLGKMPLDG
jgi:HD-GYP domain-containing protein (c-di-GMP phosphodiesterase class II)